MLPVWFIPFAAHAANKEKLSEVTLDKALGSFAGILQYLPDLIVTVLFFLGIFLLIRTCFLALKMRENQITAGGILARILGVALLVSPLMTFVLVGSLFGMQAVADDKYDGSVGKLYRQSLNEQVEDLETLKNCKDGESAAAACSKY